MEGRWWLDPNPGIEGDAGGVMLSRIQELYKEGET